MVTIILPSELEKAVAEEAARTGTTAELLTLDVLQERFLGQPSTKPLPEDVPDGRKAAGSRAAASMQPMDLSEAQSLSMKQALASGAARPIIRIAPLPEYKGRVIPAFAVQSKF
jgi:hypothetical protein